MASCSKNEVVDLNRESASGVINFSVYTSASTKAGDVTTSNVDNVGVYGVLDGADLSAPFIKNTELTTTSTGGWVTSASYYWPEDLSSTYDFYAYYPFTGVADVPSLDDNTYVAASGLPISATAIEQVDILAGNNTEATNGSTVQITLDHMLSKVDFRLGLKSEYTEGALEIEVKGITLLNINNSHSGLDLITPALVPATGTGSYTYNTATTNLVMVASTASDAGNPTVSGTTLSDPESLVSRFVDGATPNTVTSYAELNASESIEAFMLLPQTLEAGVQRVALSYTVSQYGFIVGSETEATVAYFDLKTDEIGEWKAGSSYLYTMIFDATDLADAYKISLYVTYSEWDEEDDLIASNTTEEGDE